ncbi:hypothetical protein ABEV74_15225 [Paenibacillus cisolokensis]|uniref:hypothetical protein n=1 Tax=Paenibacillus cisolokensis TaxID=1658519 RepID=UPI003D2746E4
MKFYVIFNDDSGAPANQISEYDDLAMSLIEVEEGRVGDEAWEREATRAHLYEETVDDFDQIIYKYVTTLAVGN